MTENKKRVIILGAGPAGLAAAYELIKNDKNIIPVIIDKNSSAGGLSRTVYFDGSGIDIGGHRLYSKSEYINNIWKKFLPIQTHPSKDDIVAGRKTEYPSSEIIADPEKSDDVMLIRKRFSNIIFGGKFFDYPIKFNINTVKMLGVSTSFKAGLSYIKSFVFKRKENSLEDFMINRFGTVLYEIFFKDYTKKVWGREASEISPEWGNERIRSLSLFRTLLNSMFGKISPAKKETSLIDEFYYPKFGCSQLWNKMANYVVQNGGEVIFDACFDGFVFDNKNILSVKYKKDNNVCETNADYVISTIPVKDLMKAFDAPGEIKSYASDLPYRDYILVALYTDKLNLKNYTDYPTVNSVTPSNWIYVQERDAITARLQIMNNWSCYCVKEFWDKYLVSLEYYANKDDELQQKTDEELIKIATEECQKYNLFDAENILNAKVVREENAYPAYWGTYYNISEIKDYLSSYKNLYLAGRNGMHRYANMDEAMIFGINTARKIIDANKPCKDR